MGKIIPMLFFIGMTSALNNPGRLICHESKEPNQAIYVCVCVCVCVCVLVGGACV